MRFSKYIPLLLMALAATAAASLPAGASARETPKVTVRGKRDPSTIVIRGVRDPSAWIRIETEHMVVYSDDSEEQATALVENLERLDYVLRLYMKPFLVSADGSRKLTLYFRRNMEVPPEITAVTPTLVGTAASCVSSTQAFTLDAGRIWKLDNRWLLKADDDFTLSTSMALYADLFRYRHTNIRGPAWFNAGFRAYFGGIMFTDSMMRVGRDAGASYDWLQAIDEGQPRVLTFEKVLHRDLPKEAYQPSSPTMNRPGYFAQWEFLGRSFNLLHYMLSTEENRGKLAQYLERVNDGGDPAQEFTNLFGLAGLGIDGAMLRYRTKDMKVLAVDMPELPKPALEVTRLSRIESDFVLDNAVVKACPAPGKAKQFLARLQAKAAAAPAVDFAQVTLSRAQVEWGDPREALPYLRRAVERDPYNPELHYLLGLAHLNLAAATSGDRHELLATARASFQEAAGLEPGMPEAVYGLFRAELLGGGEPSEQGVALAIDAWRRGHDVVAFARAAALAHAWLGDAAAAYQAFTTMVRNDNDPDNARWAADWLGRLEKGVAKEDLLAAMRAEKPGPPAFRLKEVSFR